MKTLIEIESEVEALAPEQKHTLYRFLEGQLQVGEGTSLQRQSVLDIAPVHLGPVLRPFSDDDDLLEEMLESRP